MQPYAMIGAAVASAIAGLWMTIGYLYYVPVSVNSASESSTDTLGTFGQFYSILQAGTTNQLSASDGLGALIVIMLFTSGTALVTIASRLTFAMARDDALPFSRYLKQLHPTTNSPVWAVLAIFISVSMLLLCQLGPDGPTAFASVVRPFTTFTQVSFRIMAAEHTDQP